VSWSWLSADVVTGPSDMEAAARAGEATVLAWANFPEP